MDKKTKILYLITGLHVGGAEMVLYRLLKKLNREKYEPVVVSIIPIVGIGERIEEEGIKILSLNAKFKCNPLIIWRVISIIKKEKPQILHSFLFHANFLGRVIGKLRNVPIIISSIHNEYFGGILREKLLKWTDRFCNITTIVSKGAAERMIDLKVVSKNKLKVIYNGIDLENFPFRKLEARTKIRKELNIEENKKILISVGRLHEAKGCPYLIKAMKILKEKYPHILLIVLGEGPEGKKIEEQIKELKLEKNILLLGQKENISEYLNASDVFVMPSLWEGLPIALLEAMACGLPVVATRVGGVPEVVEDGKSSFLVELKNPRGLAEKIIKTLEMSEEERKKMGERGRKIVEKKFSIEQMVKEYENLYQELLEKNK